jgi:hypothetical protein
LILPSTSRLSHLLEAKDPNNQEKEFKNFSRVINYDSNVRLEYTRFIIIHGMTEI